jgi:predicted dinucleotide-binding enzyme
VTRKGHEVVVSGRSDEKAHALAESLPGVGSAPLSGIGDAVDALVVAVAYPGLTDVLTQAGGPLGLFEGKTIIDCTNSIDYTSGRLIPERGSAAEQVQALAPGAGVVKGLHLFAGLDWLASDRRAERRSVVMAGSDAAAVDVASALIDDLGGVPVLIGGLDRARQLEEAAGFVTALARLGVDPSSAIPHIQF